MTPIRTASQVFDAIHVVKSAAPAFCTNFFPIERKVQAWIQRGELAGGDVRNGAAVFFRKDRDFWHVYFCAASPDALCREIASSTVFGTERLVAELVGKELQLSDPLAILENAGFRRYSLLQRMARSHGTEIHPGVIEGAHVACAEATDRQKIIELLDSCFDRYADQLPTVDEVDEAIANRQVLAIKKDDALAAILYFETHGLASTIRFWAVDERFRSLRLGAALMRHYIQIHPAARRFLLWVVPNNVNAVEKYRHYGYAADGLIDYVLANRMVCP